MHEIYERNLEELSSSKTESTDGLDLMGAMIKNSTGKQDGLLESEIMGNSFVMFLAGHETAANSIHFAILFLAIRPDLQRKLQGNMHIIPTVDYANTIQPS